jgi:hypothetical protein
MTQRISMVIMTIGMLVISLEGCHPGPWRGLSLRPPDPVQAGGTRQTLKVEQYPNFTDPLGTDVGVCVWLEESQGVATDQTRLSVECLYEGLRSSQAQPDPDRGCSRGVFCSGEDKGGNDLIAVTFKAQFDMRHPMQVVACVDACDSADEDRWTRLVVDADWTIDEQPASMENPSQPTASAVGSPANGVTSPEAR